MATLLELHQQAQDPRLQPLIGKTVLAGIWQFYEGECVEQSQDFGQITAFEETLILQKTEGKLIHVPVSYEAVVPAQRGKYKLITTGEEITNPDYLLSWRLEIADDIQESQWEANTAPHYHTIVGKEWDFEKNKDDEYLKALILSRGKELIGKTIMIGLMYYITVNDEPQFESKTQKYGRIVRISYQEGVVVQLQDGAELSLPPDISLLERAPIGSYKAKSSGDIIENPDYMTMWDIYHK
jgi:hypothetical protein